MEGTLVSLNAGTFQKGNPYRFKPGHQINLGRVFSEDHRRKIGEANRKGKGHNWKGGVLVVRGHRFIWMPDHPNANKSGYVREHVLMASKALGRPLKTGEVVHHSNGDGLDNRNHNFIICTQSYHMWLERMLAKLYMKQHFGGC